MDAVLARLRLEAELARWDAAERRARLWWRDDDARAATPALARLVALAARTQLPLTLAVVPGPQAESLAPALAGETRLTLVQHGADHENRRTGREAGEFPDAAGRALIRRRLAEGWAQIAGLPRAAKVYVPPWNHLHPELAGALRDEGYGGLSAWGQFSGRQPLPRVDAHLDLLRWRGGARARAAGDLLGALVTALQARRRLGLWDEPIGLLTHHLAHDETAWRRLEAILPRLAAHRRLRWASLDELLAPSARPRRYPSWPEGLAPAPPRVLASGDAAPTPPGPPSRRGAQPGW